MSLHHLLKSFRKLNRIGDNIIVTNMIIKNIEENKIHQNNDALNDIPEYMTIPNSPDVRDILSTIPGDEMYKHLDFLHHSQYKQISFFEKNMDKTIMYWDNNKLCLNQYWTGY